MPLLPSSSWLGIVLGSATSPNPNPISSPIPTPISIPNPNPNPNPNQDRLRREVEIAKTALSEEARARNRFGPIYLYAQPEDVLTRELWALAEANEHLDGLGFGFGLGLTLTLTRAVSLPAPSSG